MKRIIRLLLLSWLLSPVAFIEAASTEARLPATPVILTRIEPEPWAKDLQQVPGVVINSGLMCRIPYRAYRAGKYELSIYGDPERPVGIEVGLRDDLVNDEAAQSNCLQFVTSLFPNHTYHALRQLLPREREFVNYPDVTFLVRRQTDDGMAGGWSILACLPKQLNAAAVTGKELEKLTVAKAKLPAQQFVDHGGWMMTDFEAARACGVAPEVARASVMIDGNEFKNIRIVRRNPDEVIVCDAYGFSIYDLMDLNAELQKQLGNDLGSRVMSKSPCATGGAAFLLGLKSSRYNKAARDQMIKGLMEVYNRRTRRYCTEDLRVQRVTEDRVVLMLPGLRGRDRSTARAALDQTVSVEFRLVHPENDDLQPKATARDFVGPVGFTNLTSIVPVSDDREIFLHLFTTLRADLDLKDRCIDRAVVKYDEMARPYLVIGLDQEGRKRLSELMALHSGYQLAILVNGQLKSALSLHDISEDGSLRLVGPFTPEEAERLAVLLPHPLRIPVKVLDELYEWPEGTGARSQTNDTLALEDSRVYLKNYSRRNGAYAP